MPLEGQVRDVSLPEIFRLFKISRKTGVLKVTSGRQGGDVYFRDGEVYYAASTVCGAPLGERLVRAGKLRSSELQAVLTEQQARDPRPLLGAMLKEKGLVSEEALETYVREQIEDSVFNLFSWPEAEFHFIQAQTPPVQDIVVSLDAEGVIMESSRRVDEWSLIMKSLGSLEKVPSLAAPAMAREITLKPREWDVLCFIDGRRDINTIVGESGLDRFGTAKTIHGLANAGLVVMRDPTLELLGQKTAVSLRGPIDIYNLTFLTTICDTDISSHLRLEVVDDEDVEVRMSAGIREGESHSELFYFCEARTPISVVRRMALETSGFIVLVNINSQDSVVASRPDIALMNEIGDRPYVVAAYASMVDEKVTEDQIRGLLELREQVPVVACNLRDPEEAGAAISAILELIP